MCVINVCMSELCARFVEERTGLVGRTNKLQGMKGGVHVYECACVLIPGQLANGSLSLPVTGDSFRFPPTVMMGL